jgi:hypothetical protein
VSQERNRGYPSWPLSPSWNEFPSHDGSPAAYACDGAEPMPLKHLVRAREQERVRLWASVRRRRHSLDDMSSFTLYHVDRMFQQELRQPPAPPATLDEEASDEPDAFCRPALEPWRAFQPWQRSTRLERAPPHRRLAVKREHPMNAAGLDRLVQSLMRHLALHVVPVFALCKPPMPAPAATTCSVFTK